MYASTPSSSSISKEEQIRLIQRDPSLSGQDKLRMIHNLVNGNSSSATVSPPALQPNMNLTCEHYEHKKCSRLFFDCCQVYDPCHWCHLARGCKVRPAQVSKISCNVCNTEQPVGAACIACHVPFSRIHCSECKLWTEAEVFHCRDCNMCRVGKAEETYHCPDCDCCWGLEHRDNHNCVGTSWKELNCPFCLESMHYSRVPGRVLDCKHLVHMSCAENALSKNQYRCPLCRKAMCDMERYWAALRFSITTQPMNPDVLPPVRVGDTVESPLGEFYVESIGDDGNAQGYIVCPPPASQDSVLSTTSLTSSTGERVLVTQPFHDLRRKTAVNIYCYECESRSVAPFHFLGLECGHCNGFNTARA